MKRSLIIFIVFFVAAAVVFLCLVTKVKAPISDSFSEYPASDQEDQTSAKEKSTSFVFAGDMMFDRYVNHIFKDIGFNHIFDNLDKTLFAGKDIVFANLEGPVSDVPVNDDYPERTLTFNMSPETISTIKNLGLNGVSLANNHTLNAGGGGFTTTQNLLKNAGIKYGGSQNGFDDGSVIRYETEIPVSVVAVDFLSYTNTVKIDEAIKAEKDAGRFVIVFPHWGEEYSLSHTASQENAAKSFINAGAGLIIGSHPHVVEDVEVINNVPVIYSLGNFVFDQTFSKDTQEGLIVSGKISETGLEISFNPMESKKLKPQLAEENIKNQILERVLNPKNFDTGLLNGDTILSPR